VVRGPRLGADPDAVGVDRRLAAASPGQSPLRVGVVAFTHRVTTMQVRRLDRDLPLPRYAHDGDAGLDLYAAEDVALRPGERAVVRTGIAVAVPAGFVGLVVPRSGLALRAGLSMVNTPGIIDAGYRGEVKIILINHDLREEVLVARGERIGQLVVVPVANVTIEEVDALSTTSRGEGGFGSTGS
jgi:dUTP pyrophosphatase